jgi:hypothetical protein
VRVPSPIAWSHLYARIAGNSAGAGTRGRRRASTKPLGEPFFGLSSTGGDLVNETFRRKYAQSEPELMGELVYHPSPKGSPVSVPDIALPIGWLLEGESALPDPAKP